MGRKKKDADTPPLSVNDKVNMALEPCSAGARAECAARILNGIDLDGPTLTAFFAVLTEQSRQAICAHAETALDD